MLKNIDHQRTNHLFQKKKKKTYEPSIMNDQFSCEDTFHKIFNRLFVLVHLKVFYCLGFARVVYIQHLNSSTHNEMDFTKDKATRARKMIQNRQYHEMWCDVVEDGIEDLTMILQLIKPFFCTQEGLRPKKKQN